MAALINTITSAVIKMIWLINMWLLGKDTRCFGAQKMNQMMEKIFWGICKAPTGYGKSGIIFWDIATKIKTAMNENKKLVITLSTPLLVLNDQFYKDLIEFLANSGLGLNDTNCVFVDNSSVLANQRGVVAGLNVNRWGFNDFKAAVAKKILPQIVICVSTHKSYNKFLSQKGNFVLKQVQDQEYTVACYFDECHTIVNGQSNGKATNESIESDSDPVYMDELAKVADYLYFFSATPALWQAQWFVKTYQAKLNSSYNGFVHEVTILDALMEKQILPPDVTMVQVDNNKDITTICDTIETIMTSEYRGKYRKILVTAMDTDELKELRDELHNNRGVAVAFTSAATGKEVWIPKIGKQTNLSITEFSKAIEAYQGNMVILHIRQMIAGVDVPAITSVVNRVFDNTAQNVVKMIQTNGRALRVRSCDRRYFANKQEWMATKIAGEVYNIIETKNWDTDARFLARFFNLVYNSTNVKVFKLVSKTLVKRPVSPELDLVIGSGTTNTNWSEAKYYRFKLLAQFLADHAKDRKIAIEYSEFQDDFLNDAIDFINAKSADEIAEIQRQTIASLEEATFVYQDCAIHNAWSTEELKDLGIFQ